MTKLLLDPPVDDLTRRSSSAGDGLPCWWLAQADIRADLATG
ncbi:MAG: hypothetical protein ACT4OM_10485 [Actinomycetota bacterium]